MTCTHESLTCLNEFELIRKYRCLTCSAILMCICDKDIGTTFLPHQLAHGVDLETKARVLVTHGFQPSICRECRGQPVEPHPLAAIPGRTSKIRRYYWREIEFETYRRFAGIATANGWDPADQSSSEANRVRAEVSRAVLEEIKQQHAARPKYVFESESQAEVIRKYEVEVLEVEGTFAPKNRGLRARILDGEEELSPEEFVARRFRRQGWNVVQMESTPLHALFGIYMWSLIQDLRDEKNRLVMFASRSGRDSEAQAHPIHTYLPEDFGTAHYADRRATAIDAHLSPEILMDLEWLFDYWRPLSEEFRQYLWAHRDEDVRKARLLVEVLSPDEIVRILRYLVSDYWNRYLGWPDLLAYRGTQHRWLEVKASKDKLSDDQKRWIGDNAEQLMLPFALVKIHRSATRRRE